MKSTSPSWDGIGQGTASLTTITAVVKQADGDTYVTESHSLVLPFIRVINPLCMPWPNTLVAEGRIH
jgi:hypothetical protein